MYRRPLVAALAALALLGAAQAAQAHTLGHKRPYSKMTLEQVARLQVRTIRHDRQVLRFWSSRPYDLCAWRTQPASKQFGLVETNGGGDFAGPEFAPLDLLATTVYVKVNKQRCNTQRTSVRFHLAQLGWTEKALAKTRAKLAAKRAAELEAARRARTGVPSGYPPHYSAWLCIHGGEGAWNANTGNGYYGGLQMDYEFMRTYGAALLASKGTADNWTPLEQMWVAEKAYQSGRGFYPWPNTARNCGLI